MPWPIADPAEGQPVPHIQVRPDHVVQYRLLLAALFLGDALVLAMALVLAYELRFHGLPYGAEFSPLEYLLLGGVALVLWLAGFAAFGCYNRQLLLGGTQEYANVASACTLGIMGLVVLGFFRRDQLTISRGWLLLAWGLSLLLGGGLRFLIRRAAYYLRRRGYFLSPTLIVGANGEGVALARQLQAWRTSGLALVGAVDDVQAPGTQVLEGLQVLGSMADLEALVERHAVGELVIATTALSREQLLGIFRSFGTSPRVNLRLSSGLFELLTTGVQVREMGYVPLMSVNRVRLTGVDRVLKTVLDVAVTLPGLVVLAPVLAVLALVVKLDSPGPVFYRRRVVGLGGREFEALKFRTMVVDGDRVLSAHPELQEELAETHKLRDDPRITRAGRILRRWSLDELPQLLNVLRRDMSLVGPRMIAPAELADYGPWGMNLLTVRPGITGLWQVSGRADVSFEERVRLDMYYIRNYTIWLDLQILFVQTPSAVLRGRGAY